VRPGSVWAHRMSETWLIEIERVAGDAVHIRHIGPCHSGGSGIIALSTLRANYRIRPLPQNRSFTSNSNI
jgi:hypothetical protein